MSLIRLADKAQNSKCWTPADALREALSDIESGKAAPVKLCVHFYEDDGNRLTHHYYVAGMDRAEHIALLEVAKARAIEDWLV